MTKSKHFLFLVFLLSTAVSVPFLHGMGNQTAVLGLSEADAWRFSKLALNCIEQEFPNKPDHVMGTAAEVLAPSVLHPAFFGCYDWHSSVHGHWLLVKVLKLYPNLEQADRIRAALNKRLTYENIQKEIAYFQQANRTTFERPYGWAWLLKLSVELATWSDEDGIRWNAIIKPLADLVVKQFIEFFPKQTYPIRTGVHPNTAFALSFAWDYAQAIGHSGLKKLCEERAQTYYLHDVGCPASWEPGGEDFFSPCLMEADLMRRILDKKDFTSWWEKFLSKTDIEMLFLPAVVSDRSDPKLAHLDGLNYSRAWCLSGIGHSLQGKTSQVFSNAASQLVNSSLPFLTSEHYEGSHWLGTFALLAIDTIGRKR